WIGPFDKAWKLDPGIGSLALTTPERQALAARNELELTVTLFGDADLNAAVTQIGNLPGVIISDPSLSIDNSFIQLTMPAASYRQLADIDAVQFVEEAGEITVRNDTNKWILQTNVSGSTTVWDHGIHGENQIAGHIDQGVRQDHCAFADPNGNPIGPTHR